MPLLQYLSSLNQSSSSSRGGSKSKSSKTRSHSVPHFNQLKTLTTENNSASEVATGVDDQTTSQESGGTTTGSDTNSLDNRSTHSAEQQQQSNSVTTTPSEESSQPPIIDLLTPTEPVLQPAFFIAPITDATTSSKLANDLFENITDDEKRRIATTSKSNGYV